MSIRRAVFSLGMSVALLGCSSDTLSENPDAAPVDSPVETQSVPEYQTDLPPLPIEEMGRVEVLPDEFPETWMYVDEASFFNMFGGKIILLDVAETIHADRIKGIADKNLLGNFVAAKERSEFYIMESFHERGSRGPRTDVLAIYDKTTMAPIKELVWTDTTRLQALPERYAMALSEDERFLFVSNFSPATSFTVVDLSTHEIVETIGTPGCVLTYPSGNRRIVSICSNGGLLTTTIDDDGRKKSQQRMAPFFDPIDTPVFERPAIIGDIAYFPGFKGMLHEVDISGETAQYLGSWSLVNEEQRADNWRPGGLVLGDRDDQGRVYFIMHPDGKEGTQTHGGPQVWVFDVKEKKRLQVIETPNWAISIAVTRGKEPLLVVTSGELNLDVINVADGSLVQTVGDFGNVTPLLVHKAQ